jgi:hypothetical protein
MLTVHATRRVTIPARGATLYGDLSWPIAPGRVHGLTVLAHPTSGARLNPRNQALAELLNRAGLATLLTDLLGADEDQWEASAARARYDVDLLTARLRAVVERLARLEIEIAALPVGVLATGAAVAAAVRVATELAAADEPTGGPPRPAHIDAIVSRNGTPDLVADLLPTMEMPALFLVGEREQDLLHRHRLAGVTAPVLVPGAGDLAEDRAAAETAAVLASRWLVTQLDPQEA